LNTNTQQKILIVEDDPQIQQIYEFKLEKSSFDVRTAANGEMGLAEAEAFTPDLILLDLRMPIMSGDTMLEQLRSKDWGADMRVIILTNISKDEAPRSLGFLGVDRYVVKAHHTPSQVVEIVREVLAGS
jgi:two-component system alkaline phosphatase synthesis response regulator PhoP